MLGVAVPTLEKNAPGFRPEIISAKGGTAISPPLACLALAVPTPGPEFRNHQASISTCWRLPYRSLYTAHCDPHLVETGKPIFNIQPQFLGLFD